jgi:ribonuclease HI
MKSFSLFRLRCVHVFTDGAIRPDAGASGLAAIVRDEGWDIRHWWSRKEGRMTCNEAEYAAVILALEALRTLCPQEVHIYSDSQVVVHQMQGLAATRAPALRQSQARARALVVQFKRVIFHHIPREHNRLADALANDTVDGRWG